MERKRDYKGRFTIKRKQDKLEDYLSGREKSN